MTKRNNKASIPTHSTPPAYHDRVINAIVEATKSPLELKAEQLYNKFGEDVDTTVRHLRDARGQVPTLINAKPKWKDHFTSVDATAFAKELEAWELDKIVTDEAKAKWKQQEIEDDQVLEIYIKDAANFKDIPEQYRDKVWSYAWSDGHSNGYSEVFNILCSLVEIFNI